MSQNRSKIAERVRIRLIDSEKEINPNLLYELVDTAIDRINLNVGDTEFNPIFNSIAVDVAVKMYRRLYHEGIESENADTISTKFISDILAEYKDELVSYKKDRLAIAQKAKVRFL